MRKDVELEMVRVAVVDVDTHHTALCTLWLAGHFEFKALEVVVVARNVRPGDTEILHGLQRPPPQREPPLPTHNPHAPTQKQPKPISKLRDPFHFFPNCETQFRPQRGVSSSCMSVIIGLDSRSIVGGGVHDLGEIVQRIVHDLGGIDVRYGLQLCESGKNYGASQEPMLKKNPKQKSSSHRRE